MHSLVLRKKHSDKTFTKSSRETKKTNFILTKATTGIFNQSPPFILNISLTFPKGGTHNKADNRPVSKVQQ